MGLAGGEPEGDGGEADAVLELIPSGADDAAVAGRLRVVLDEVRLRSEGAQLHALLLHEGARARVHVLVDVEGDGAVVGRVHFHGDVDQLLLARTNCTRTGINIETHIYY